MKRALTAAVIAAALAGVAAPVAEANPLTGGGNCTAQPWFYVMAAATRTICDDPRRADGSWNRCRQFAWGVQGFTVAGRYGGAYVTPAGSKLDCYSVTDATVLPDEPPFLG